MGWSQVYRQNGSDIVKHTFPFVADGAGAATVASGLPVSGEIQRVVIDPLSPAPTAAYDLTLTDEDSIDVLAAQGANLDATASKSFVPGTPLTDGTTTSTRPIVVDGILTLNVTNAGSGGAGKVVVYVR